MPINTGGQAFFVHAYLGEAAHVGGEAQAAHRETELDVVAPRRADEAAVGAVKMPRARRIVAAKGGGKRCQ